MYDKLVKKVKTSLSQKDTNLSKIKTINVKVSSTTGWITKTQYGSDKQNLEKKDCRC